MPTICSGKANPEALPGVGEIVGLPTEEPDLPSGNIKKQQGESEKGLEVVDRERKRTMRRIALLPPTLGVLLLLAFGALVGCGSGHSTVDPPTVDTPEEVVEAVAPAVDEASIREHLGRLTGEAPVRSKAVRRPRSWSAGARKGGERPPSTWKKPSK